MRVKAIDWKIYEAIDAWNAIIGDFQVLRGTYSAEEMALDCIAAARASGWRPRYRA